MLFASKSAQRFFWILTTFLSEQDNRVALGGTLGPVFWNEFPLIERTWTDGALLSDFLDEIIAEILVGGPHDTFGEVGFGDAGPFR